MNAVAESLLVMVGAVVAVLVATIVVVIAMRKFHRADPLDVGLFGQPPALASPSQTRAHPNPDAATVIYPEPVAGPGRPFTGKPDRSMARSARDGRTLALEEGPTSSPASLPAALNPPSGPQAMPTGDPHPSPQASARPATTRHGSGQKEFVGDPPAARPSTGAARDWDHAHPLPLPSEPATRFSAGPSLSSDHPARPEIDLRDGRGDQATGDRPPVTGQEPDSPTATAVAGRSEAGPWPRPALSPATDAAGVIGSAPEIAGAVLPCSQGAAGHRNDASRPGAAVVAVHQHREGARLEIDGGSLLGDVIAPPRGLAFTEGVAVLVSPADEIFAWSRLRAWKAVADKLEEKLAEWPTDVPAEEVQARISALLPGMFLALSATGSPGQHTSAHEVVLVRAAGRAVLTGVQRGGGRVLIWTGSGQITGPAPLRESVADAVLWTHRWEPEDRVILAQNDGAGPGYERLVAALTGSGAPQAQRVVAEVSVDQAIRQLTVVILAVAMGQPAGETGG